MKIAYVFRHFDAGTTDPLALYVHNVTRTMSKRGHEVYIITEIVPALHRLEFNIHIIPVLPPRTDMYYLGDCQEYSERVYLTLKKVSQYIDLDAIEFAERGAEGFITIRAKKLLNEFPTTGLIVKLHGPSFLLASHNEERRYDFHESILRYAEEYCLNNADRVTSSSTGLAEHVRETLCKRSIEKSPYPLPSAPERRSRHFTDAQRYRVVLIGSLQPRTGLDLFLKAAQLIQEREKRFTFEIYGEDTCSDPFGDSYMTYLKRQISPELQEKVVFRGAVSLETLPELLSNACFCVLPSRWEGWPSLCLEAMSQGCVVIGSQFGGMSEIIEHGISGFLINPYTEAEIARILLEHSDDYQLLQGISANARARAQLLCEPTTTCQQIEQSYRPTVIARSWPISGHEPLVSICIPLYNQGQYIQEAIDSVSASSYKNREIIVVNDGSTDLVTKQAFHELEGVIKISKPNGGLASARNAGIAAARGEFIMTLDADDRIHPLYIEKAVAALVNNPELSYVTCYSKNFGAFGGGRAPVGYVPDLMLFMLTDGRCTNLYRIEALRKTNSYDETMIASEDWDLLISLHKNGCIGDVLPLELFYYRRHYTSMSYTTSNPKRVEVLQYMLHKHKDILLRYPESIVKNLLYLWKNNYETSESLRNQSQQGTLPPDT